MKKASTTQRVSGCVIGAAGLAALFIKFVPAWAAVIALTLGAFLAWPTDSKAYLKQIKDSLPIGG